MFTQPSVPQAQASAGAPIRPGSFATPSLLPTPPQAFPSPPQGRPAGATPVSNTPLGMPLRTGPPAVLPVSVVAPPQQQRFQPYPVGAPAPRREEGGSDEGALVLGGAAPPQVGPGALVLAGGDRMSPLALTGGLRKPILKHEPRGKPETFTVEEIKRENEQLLLANDNCTLECERLQLANDVLRARVRQRERDQLRQHHQSIDDLGFAKAFIEHEREKQLEEEEQKQMALEEENRRLREEQEHQQFLCNMTPEERAEHDAEQQRKLDEIQRALQEAQDAREAEERRKRELASAHEKRVRDWAKQNDVKQEATITQLLELDVDRAHEVMRGKLNFAYDKDAVVIARMNKLAPTAQMKAQQMAAKRRLDVEESRQKAEAEAEVVNLAPGQLCDDPLKSNDALLRHYCFIMALSRPGTIQKYENFLTKSTMWLQDPNGEEMEVTVRVPGRNPDKLLMRELVCGELLGMIYPGKDRDDILAELERMKMMKEIMKREKLKKPVLPAGMALIGAAATPLQIMDTPAAAQRQLAMAAAQAQLKMAEGGSGLTATPVTLTENKKK
eukprot:Hpha_TRINITY_DN9040_c0_g1::TRINITY_DN9040_c0_g1_i1::g.142029::m.142029